MRRKKFLTLKTLAAIAAVALFFYVVITLDEDSAEFQNYSEAPKWLDTWHHFDPNLMHEATKIKWWADLDSNRFTFQFNYPTEKMSVLQDSIKEKITEKTEVDCATEREDLGCKSLHSGSKLNALEIAGKGEHDSIWYFDFDSGKVFGMDIRN